MPCMQEKPEVVSESQEDGEANLQRKPLMMEQQEYHHDVNENDTFQQSNPNQFFTVKLDIYKAAKLNSILSEINFNSK